MVVTGGYHQFYNLFTQETHWDSFLFFFFIKFSYFLNILKIFYMCYYSFSLYTLFDS